MFKNLFKKTENKKENEIVNRIEPIKTLDDEFFKWLTFANVGWLNPGNAYCMDYAISRISTDSPVIEIGSFSGLSTNAISYLLRKHSKSNTFITSDPWIFAGLDEGSTAGNSKITQSEYREFVINSFKRNVQFFSRDAVIHTIESTSDDFFKLWANNNEATDIFDKKVKLGGNISFAYIDGNHTYEFAKRDFQNVSKYLDYGGFILFDDTGDHTHFPCKELMPEIIDNSEYELVMKNPNYLFRKIK